MAGSVKKLDEAFTQENVQAKMDAILSGYMDPGEIKVELIKLSEMSKNIGYVGGFNYAIDLMEGVS